MLNKSQQDVREVKSRLLAEAAGVRVVMTTPEQAKDDATTIAGTSRVWLELSLREAKVKSDKKFLGFHLTRSKWDPYPWIGYVETGSVADLAGLKAGDCLLNVAGDDLIGLGVKEVASLIRNSEIGTNSSVRVQVWRNVTERRENDGKSENERGVALSGPLPEVARKLATAVSGTISALECPVCLDSAASPVSQCVHGHILCVGCRAKTPRCPVCRVRLGQGRCLLADELQRNIRQAFEDDPFLSNDKSSSLRDKLFGKIDKNKERNENENLFVFSGKIKSSIARLFNGGFDKAASAENLTSGRSDESKGTGPAASYRRLNELTRSDRTKSASTGELSLVNESRNADDRTLSGLLSVPQTPTWGASTESVVVVDDSSYRCPLSRSTGCGVRNSSVYSVLEHLASSHEDAPQIRFTGKIARIPWPLPFAPATYLISHRRLFFFVQFENENVWIAGSGNEDLGEWALIGTKEDQEIFESRRVVARLNDDSAPVSRHMISLSKNLEIDTLVVKLLDAQRPEGYSL